jgi:hypothetical protein
MTTKDAVPVEHSRNPEVPIEAVMYHDSKHLNVEAADEVQADRKAWESGNGFDRKRDRLLVWKIDWRLLPMLGIIYGMSVISFLSDKQCSPLHRSYQYRTNTTSWNEGRTSIDGGREICHSHTLYLRLSFSMHHLIPPL